MKSFSCLFKKYKIPCLETNYIEWFELENCVQVDECSKMEVVDDNGSLTHSNTLEWKRGGKVSILKDILFYIRNSNYHQGSVPSMPFQSLLNHKVLLYVCIV